MGQNSLFGEDFIYEKRKEKFEGMVSAGVALHEAEQVAFTPLPLPETNLCGKKPEIPRVAFYFNGFSEVELVKKYFEVNEYVEMNTRKTELLVAILNMFESGALKLEEVERWKTKNMTTIANAAPQ